MRHCGEHALEHGDVAPDASHFILTDCLVGVLGLKTNTLIDALVPWRPDFDRDRPMFEPLRPLLEPFRLHREWPGLDAYQQLLDSLDEPLRTRHGAALSVVPQDARPDHFEQHYAPRIYLSGEIQSRTRNWHDFFQLLTWLLFPRTKATINALHFPGARARNAGGGDRGRRTALENMLSLFDEGGAVLISSDDTLLQLARDFQWKTLFWERRDELASRFECITFGHALYEKGLKPYLGMTANAILIEVEDDYFAQPMARRHVDIDDRLTSIFERGERYTRPRDLSPFPILGLPGWDRENENEAYYDNIRYFRPGRGR